jgi:hypothetical protein
MCPYYVAGIIDIAALTGGVYTSGTLDRCASECESNDTSCTICSMERASVVGPALPQDHFIGPSSRGVCLCTCASIPIISLVEGVCRAADT